MTDWHGNRANESYTYRRVKWSPGNPDHFSEGEEYGNITSGSVELAALTDLKASCTFSFEGGTPPDTTDMVRIYYSFDDDEGSHAETVLGTFFISCDDIDYTRDGDRLITRGSADGSSVLSVLLDRELGAPYAEPEGIDCIEEAVAIIEGFGLRTNSPESPGTKLKTSHTFKSDDSWITVVNYLLTSANYQAAYPDQYGTVVISPYIEPEYRTVTATFRDDERSIMYPEVGMQNEWSEIHNVVRLCFQNDDECIAASASLVSGSKASLESRGWREKTLTEDVTELDGDTQADRLANLKDMARKKLVDNASEIEKVTFTHAFISGMQPNDAVSIEYSDMTWKGNVTNMQITLGVSTPCTTKLRRFVTGSLEIVTDGGILW